METERLIGVGILVVFIGLIIIFMGVLTGNDSNSKTKIAVGGLIGFIPFGFGNDKKMVWAAIIISFVALAVWIFLNYRR